MTFQSHPNILPLYGKFVHAETRRIGLVSPHRSEEDIGTFLDAHHAEVTVADRKHLLKGVINGLLFIHKQGCSHGDIKPRNILISESHESAEGRWNPEIADFGGSRARKGDTTVLKYSIQYTSPEVLLHEEDTNGNVTSKSDVYSLAMTMLQVLSGRDPFPNINEMKLLRLLTSTEGILPDHAVHTPIHSNDATSHWQLMSDCWNRDPDARPTIKDVARRFG
ncbi:kinase-like domain-containing protein [Cyathus striatus]|nr:kinase-like domain-containing protein [Cyathus striatus]